MRSVIINPHRMADPSSVRPPQWITESGGLLVGERLDQWIPTEDLAITGRLEIVFSDFMGSAGLSLEDEIVVVASWFCPVTHQRGAQRFGPDSLRKMPFGYDLRISIPAGAVDGCIQIRTSVCLHRKHVPAKDPSVAIEPGSILWQDHPVGRPVSLGSPRFPVACVDFKASGLGEVGSAWRVCIDTNSLELPVGRVVRLYVNTLNVPVVRALTADSKEPDAGQVLALLRFAVERELVLAALPAAERLEGVDWPEGSLGALLLSVLVRRFPDTTPSALAARIGSDPGRFETELQARLGFLQPS